MIILGVNAYHGDAGAALVVDGQLMAAVEEERFNRVKHWAGLPVQSMRYCLNAAGLSIDQVDHLAISRNPRAHLYQKILFALSRRPDFRWIHDRVANAVRVRNLRENVARRLGVASEGMRFKVHFVEHHPAHIASTFFVSPFQEAACLSIDGFGDFLSAMWGAGRGSSIQVLGQVAFPHSLGLFYTAVTQYLGFPKYGDEYKVMGLAPYGEPEYLEEFRRIVQARPRGFVLDAAYFLHHSEGVTMTWEGGEPVLGQVYSDLFVKRFGPPREGDGAILPRHRNIAASLQALTEEVYFHLLNLLHDATGLSKLCLAGGVALNAVANGKIFDSTPFEQIFIQPAAGDAGTAIGAAFSVWHSKFAKPRSFVMTHAYWGPAFLDQAIRQALEECSEDLRGARVILHNPHDDQQLCELTATALAAGKIVGWFQGRMEWGPRALGNRSILADPRRAEIRDLLNARIKKREPFRPFCPSILQEYVGHYFEKNHPDPFMITVYPIRSDKQSVIPAVTHVDGTARLQSVNRQDNPLFWKLIHTFYEMTGIPVLLNTSFNENEPIVHTPQQALDCFLRTKMDVLVMGHHMVERCGSDERHPSPVTSHRSSDP